MKKYLKLLFVAVLVIVAAFLFVLRNHLGFFEYLYSAYTNTETKLVENHLLSVLKNDPDNLFKEFREQTKLHPVTQNTCHGIAHKLGHESFELYGFEQSMHIAQAYCGGGFIHGVIEAKFGLLTYKDIEGIKTVCKDTDQSCNHGIGHGLMVLTQNNFKEALGYCDTLAPAAHSDCYDGVFMHIFDNEDTGISKNIPERAEGVNLCSVMEEKYQKSCYFYAPRVYAQDKNLNVESKTMCDSVLGINHIVCVVGTGTMIGKYRYEDEKEAEDMCLIFGSDTHLCLEGVSDYRNKTFVN